MSGSASRRQAGLAALSILVVLLAAGPARAEYPADCPDRDDYRYFPKLPLDPRLPVVPVPPWCPEETGRMVALAGASFQTLSRGFMDIAITVSPGAGSLEVGIFDGDTGWPDGQGLAHWDAGSTELGYCLFYDPAGDLDEAPLPSDEIGMWLGNSLGEPTLGPGWTASPDHFPDNAWWTFELTDLAPGLGADGNYHFRLIVLYQPTGLGPPPLPDPNAATVSDFRVRGKATGGAISFGSREFAFEGAFHSPVDAQTIFPWWDPVQDPWPLPAGSTLWNDFVAAGQTTYDGTWFFSAQLPHLASIELYDGDFDFGNDPLGQRTGNPSGITIPACNDSTPQDDDDADSFVFPNATDDGFPEFVVLDPDVPPGDPDYPVGTDESKPQRAVPNGGFPKDDTCYDASRRSPCVKYTLIDPNGVEYPNLNPSSQREWEQFRICSLTASEPDKCDYTVNEQVLPRGLWSAVIEGMDMTNLNTWHFEIDPVTLCGLTISKSATPDHVTVEGTGCAELGKPNVLEFEYTGGGCDQSSHDQGDKATCSGDPAGAEPVEIVVTKDADKNVVSPVGEVVNVGDTVTFTATGDRLPSETRLEIRQGGVAVQTLTIHTSCSQPLEVGDVFGAMKLLSFNGQGATGTNDVTYTYVVRNIEDDLSDVMIVDDKLGVIDGPTYLAMGETRTYTRVVPIYEETTNVVEVTGVGPGGLQCEASATATVTVEDGGDCEALGNSTLKFKKKDVKWKLENLGGDAITIETIELAWPAANGMLKEVKLQDTFVKGTFSSPATLTGFGGDPADRTLDPGEDKDLKLKFEHNADKNGDYTIRVDFAEGCSVEFGGGGGGEFSCEKPLDALTMIWDGTEPEVGIKAWKDVPGEILLADVSGITLGSEVTVTGYAPKDGNDVIWEVFDAGGTKIGESTFHMSCSDDDMDGPEDCGKREGDGKGLSGYINDWLLEGMVDAVGTLDCTP